MISERSRFAIRAAILAGGGLFAGSDASVAQEVLFLHIRPQADRAALGQAGSAQAALSAREAVFERSNARARVIIEAVCTGCLGPWAAPAPRPMTTAAISEIPAPRGVESDPPLEASDATSDPAIPENRP
jgi:hypothetical protein